MMSLRQFDGLARCYGADLRRWPDADRTAASALLSAQTGSGREARAIRDRQLPLDEAIQNAFAADAAERWHEGEETAALERLRSDVDRRIGAQLRAKGGVAWPDWMPARGWKPQAGWLWPGRGAIGLRGVGLAAGSGVMVLTGLWVGMTHHAGMPADLFGALQALPFGGPGL